MFEFCPLIDKEKIIKKCPFAAKRENNIHCGLNKTLTLEENNVRNMKQCPLKSKKYTKKTRR